MKGRRGRPWRLPPFRRRFFAEGLVGDTIANIVASLLLALFTAVLLTNTTFEVSLFTSWRNAFVSPDQVAGKLRGIHGLGLTDETDLLARDKNLPDGDLSALAAALRKVIEYSHGPGSDKTGRPIVVGVDYVLSSAEEGDAPTLAPLVKVLSQLPDNVRVVLGCAVVHEGPRWGYLRADLLAKLWEAVKANVRARTKENPDAAAEDYVSHHLFLGNLHILKGQVVSGFQQLDTQLALGYAPLLGQDPVYFPALPLTMYLLGERRLNGSELTSDTTTGDIPGASLDATLLSLGLPDARNLAPYPLRYNVFASVDLSDAPGKVSALYRSLGDLDPDWAPLADTAQAMLPEKDQWDISGGTIGGSSPKGDYYLIYRNQSAGFLQSGTSTDVVATPASQTSPFTNNLNTVSGAMTHLWALSNLIQGDVLREVPEGLDLTLAIVLSVLAFWMGLRWEFRAALVGALVSFLAVLFLAYCLFLTNWFFPCRWPLLLPGGISLVLAGARFLVTQDRNDKRS